MTPAEINQAIAESVGWKPTTDSGWCMGPDGEPIITLPNYHGDLNACAEFEDALRGTDEEYHNDPVHYRRYTEYQYGLMSRFGASAPAPARCEFYLRITGKWREQ